MNAVEPLTPADFQALFESSPEVLFVMQAEAPYTVVAVNGAFTSVTMTRRDDILGQGLFDIFPANSDDPASHNMPDVLVVLDRIRATGKGERVGPYRYDIPRPAEAGGGFEERHWLMTITPASFTAGGQPRLLLAQTRDITAKVYADAEISDARARLEATLGAAEIGTWIWDPERDRVYADRNLAAFFNVSAADAEGGPIEHYTTAIHEDDRARVSAAIGGGRARGRELRDGVPARAARPAGALGDRARLGGNATK